MSKAPTPLPPEVLAAFERRQPIEAIKLLLQSLVSGGTPTRLSNKLSALTPSTAPQLQSKEPAASQDGLSPGEVSQSESTFWAWVVAALIGYLAFRLFIT
jgi:hypothetical protein